MSTHDDIQDGTVSLPLLEGLSSRPGASHGILRDALKRHDALRRMVQFLTAVSVRRAGSSSSSSSSSKRSTRSRRPTKRRKIDTTAAVPFISASSGRLLLTNSSSSSWSHHHKTPTLSSALHHEHWILHALLAPSLKVRQVALRILFKGAQEATPEEQWQLVQALVAWISHCISSNNSREQSSLLVLVGLLHFLVNDSSSSSSTTTTTALFRPTRTAFVAAGGLHWVARCILQVALDDEEHSSQPRLMLLLDLLQGLVLQVDLSEEDASSSLTTTTMNLKSTLQSLYSHFWSCSSPAWRGMSPLACLIAAKHVVVVQQQQERGSDSFCILDVLKRMIRTTTRVRVSSTSNSTNEASSPAARSAAPPPSAAAAAARASLDAVLLDSPIMEEEEEEDEDMEYVEGQPQQEEQPQEEEEGEAQEQGNGNMDNNEDDNDDMVLAVEEEDEEFGTEEEADHEDDEDSEDDEEEEGMEMGEDLDEEEGGGDDEAAEAEELGGILSSMQQFEQRLVGLAGMAVSSRAAARSQDESPATQGSSLVPPLIESKRKQAYIRASMQVLAAQHPPATHVSVSAGADAASRRPLLAPAAEEALLKSVCNVVKPPRKPLNLKIFMRRAPTQEEFFRGSLSRNPIPISLLSQREAGTVSNEPTVRDLRQHIANDLQMADSAELIEILVANKILDMSLKLRVVHQVLWRNHLIENSGSSSGASSSSLSFGSGLSMIFSFGSDDRLGSRNVTADTPLSALPPMAATYRLAGVDGEATEDHVDSLEDPEAPSSSASPEEQERALEKEYSITRQATEGRGISILLRSVESDISDTLRRIRRDDVGRQIGSNPSRSLFQKSQPGSGLTLLRHCSKLASNRKKLLEARAPTTLLRLLLDVLHALDETQSSLVDSSDEEEEEKVVEAGDQAHAVTNPTADVLKELIETLASDISTEAESTLTAADLQTEAKADSEQDASTLPLLLSSLKTIFLGPPLRKVIAKLLPFLTYGQVSLSRELASHFVSHVKVDALGDFENSTKPTTRSSVLMDTFIQAAISLPPSEVCNSLRAELMKCGFVEKVVEFVLRDIPSLPPPWSTALWPKTDKVGSKRDKLEKGWRSYFQRSGLRTAFQMLAGMCNCHWSTQSFIADVGGGEGKGITSFLTACHWMETTSDNRLSNITTGGLGLLSETLLDELAQGNEKVAKRVDELRKKTRDRKKELAEERRNKALVSMGSFAGSASLDQQHRDETSSGVVEGVARTVGAVLGLFRESGAASAAAAAANASARATRSENAVASKKLEPSIPSWLAEMEALQDETGLKCAVCQEGRTLQPSELLGLYVYIKKVAIPHSRCGGQENIDGTHLLVSLPPSLPESLINTHVDHEWFQLARSVGETLRNTSEGAANSGSGSSSQSRRTSYVTTSVSAGNAIHCRCHERARSEDRNHPRAPKSEWEGASLRNSRVACNAILPLVSSRSSNVPLVAVDVALSDYQTAIANLLGSRPKSPLWSILHDIRLLLFRMAYGEALNVDCGGGSLSSNSALLFYELLMADMFTNDADHESPQAAQHARILSAGFLAAVHILRAPDYETTGLPDPMALTRAVADAAPMAALCCILYHNTSDEDPVVPDKAIAPHPRRRWAVHKEDFLRGLLVCAGRRHALSLHDSGCSVPARGGRASTRTSRSSSFNDWDVANEDGPAGSPTNTAVAHGRRKHPSRKRGLPQIDDFAVALRPLITLYAILDQISTDFVVNMNDERVSESAERLTHTVEACQKSSSIYDLLDRAKVTLDHEGLIEELQKGMIAA